MSAKSMAMARQCLFTGSPEPLLVANVIVPFFSFSYTEISEDVILLHILQTFGLSLTTIYLNLYEIDRE